MCLEIAKQQLSQRETPNSGGIRAHLGALWGLSGALWGALWSSLGTMGPKRGLKQKCVKCIVFSVKSEGTEHLALTKREQVSPFAVNISKSWRATGASDLPEQ